MLSGQRYDAMLDFCASNTSANAPCIEEPVRIGAWNLQRFGVAKMENEDVVRVIVEVMSFYDLMVMQEVTDVSGSSVPALLKALNQRMGGDQVYVAVESPRIGRTSYKEQYVFVYKPSRMTFLEGFQYVEKADVFQIEPFIAHFSSNSTGDLTEFAIIPLHAKPDDAPHELDALVDVYDEMVASLGIENAIILGDFNAGCSYVSQAEFDSIRLHTDPRFHWVISDHEDTTTKTTSCPYDRIVLAGPILQTSAYYKTASAFYFDEAFGMEVNRTLVEDVSDHYPVGVMLRGSVPPSVHAMYGGDNASHTSSLEILVSVSVDLPPQEGWASVLDILRGTQDCSSNTFAAAAPDVTFVAGTAYAECRLDNVDKALTLVISLAAQNPHVIPAQTVAVLGYKAGHGTLSDISMYAARQEPQYVRVSLTCQEEPQGVLCSLALSVRTGIN
ncbi:Endonuclease/exonuclease/phosphatase [Trinorchestia longiramus]|nr:Endonuclease/exonuclease/phosphatase [Trinorchestia longiramus]